MYFHRYVFSNRVCKVILLPHKSFLDRPIVDVSLKQKNSLLTHQLPFAAGHKALQVSFRFLQLQINLMTVIAPRTKLKTSQHRKSIAK